MDAKNALFAVEIVRLKVARKDTDTNLERMQPITFGLPPLVLKPDSFGDEKYERQGGLSMIIERIQILRVYPRNGAERAKTLRDGNTQAQSDDAVLFKEDPREDSEKGQPKNRPEQNPDKDNPNIDNAADLNSLEAQSTAPSEERVGPVHVTA